MASETIRLEALADAVALYQAYHTRELDTPADEARLFAAAEALADAFYAWEDGQPMPPVTP